MAISPPLMPPSSSTTTSISPYPLFLIPTTLLPLHPNFSFVLTYQNHHQLQQSLSLSLSPIMAAEYSGSTTSNTHLLQELEALSQTLYQPPHTTNRRTNSLALPRASVPPIPTDEPAAPKIDEKLLNPKPRQRRMSLSPWRSRPKLDDESEEKERAKAPPRREVKKLDDKATAAASSSDKKGLWNWKPIRALSHIGMQKLSCLFSIEVVTVQGLPASMNGLRLSVCVRKKETKDGAVHTMPSRVSQGAADFEETLFIRCHVYCTTGGGGTTQLKFEPRPFVIYAFAVDAEELDFGRSSVDLSHLIQESIEKNSEGTRVRQWDTSFNLSGKAKGGELVLKLGFQLMEKDGGIGIYSQAVGQKSSKGKNISSARTQSKSSFSIPSPRMSSRAEAWTPSQSSATADFQGIDDLNLDEPAPIPSPPPPVPSPLPPPSVQKSEEPEPKMEDLDLPDFDIVDKGVEIQDKTNHTDEEQSEENSDKRSVSSEVVKEVVHDQVHLTRLTELDSIAQQIKALESIMGNEKSLKTEEETAASPRLDADEETVTREFLQLLEGEEGDEFNINQLDVSPLKPERGSEDSTEVESNVFIPDLGKGLGCVVQTRDGGYLAAMNPLDTEVARKDTPKLAMQISKPLVLPSDQSSGFELFQRMAAIGLEALNSEILSLMPVEELMGKTAEQIAFEGIASAIIQGRNKEGANSSAARTIAAVKTMAAAMSAGRKERISSGIWNMSENPLSADEILAFTVQKIEAMAVEALKIQAEMAEEDAPFDVSPVNGKPVLSSAVPLEDWTKSSSNTTSHKETGESAITISVVVQLRDPLRRYEAVGSPVIALINAISSDANPDNYDDEKRFKVASLHVGGVRVRTRGKRNVWDTEKQRLTAMQWLVAHGLGKAGKKGKPASSKDQDLLWSISSRAMADMWLKPMRNPDVKFNK